MKITGSEKNRRDSKKLWKNMSEWALKLGVIGDLTFLRLAY